MKRFRRFCKCIEYIDPEPELIKGKDDSKDFVEYGGTIPPKVESIIRRSKSFIETGETIQEHRANLYDFTDTMPHWENKDVKQELQYKFLSTKFKKLFDNRKVSYYINHLDK